MEMFEIAIIGIAVCGLCCALCVGEWMMKIAEKVNPGCTDKLEKWIFGR